MSEIKPWNYSGRPTTSERDKVRFLVGDTCSTDPLVSDNEIEYALNENSNPVLAAAIVARHLAAKFSRLVSSSVGSVSSSCDQKAKAFLALAKELDPCDVTKSAATRALPSFGGRTYSEKLTYDTDSDAVQPSFSRGQDDMPGGPDDSNKTNEWDNWP